MRVYGDCLFPKIDKFDRNIIEVIVLNLSLFVHLNFEGACSSGEFIKDRKVSR